MVAVQKINEEVNVTALYFRSGHGLKSFPKRMEFAGHEYTFKESGLQYKITAKDHELRLFDMTDGLATYRLKLDPAKLIWTLVSISSENARAFLDSARSLNFNRI